VLLPTGLTGLTERHAADIIPTNLAIKNGVLLSDRLSHHAVIYVPTGLVVMALRNASGEVTVEIVCVPSPTP
jgi:hypothetical protein